MRFIGRFYKIISGEMKKYSKKYWVLRSLFLLAYLAASAVLIVESTLPVAESAKKSNAVGAVVGGLVNDMNGDQAKEVLPTEAVIQNKKTDYKVGEEVQIDVKTKPEDATYRSYTYQSSNEEVASIDETGLVSFLSAGNATITATNTKVPEVFDTIDFVVSNIEVTSMTSSINASLEDGVYLLEVYKNYVIKNVIEPENATEKTVTYDYTPNSYFELEDDTIHVNEDSGEQVIDISVTCGSITNVLKVKTYAPAPVVEDYPIEGLKASNYTKYTDQTSVFTPSISYVPSYTSAKYKGYTLTSDNESIVKVQTNNTSLKPTGTAGVANITATSSYNPDIKVTFKVTVQNRPAMTSIKLGSYSSVMYVGATQTVSVSVTPSSAKVTKTFSSSNTSAITVTNAGKLTAKALGTSTITAKVKDSYNNELSKTFTIEVKEKPLVCASDFVIDYKQGENPIVYANEEINLKSYFGIKSFEGNSEPLSTNEYDFSFALDPEVGEYSAYKFTAHKVGEIEGQITYTNQDSSVIAKDIKFTVMDHYEVYKGEDKLTESSIALNVYDTVILSIKDNGLTGQSYKIVSDDSQAIVYSYASKSITITGKEAGNTTLKIVPVIKQEGYDDKELESKSKELRFVVSDIVTSKMDITLYRSSGDTIKDNEEVILLYMNETLSVKYALDENTTRSRVTMRLNNTNASIRNGLITPKKIGNTRLTVTEGVSGIKKEYDIAIRHKVALKEGGPFLLSGMYEYDAESNTISIVNGDSAKIAVNFTSDSSYKKVNYTVDNEDICLVGEDGTITPLKAGDTKVNVCVKDDNYTYIEFDVNITITKRPFITDMKSFFLKVRKALGHFGAFAVVGLLGAITWFLWLRGKKWFPVGVFANFALGFGLSWLTEDIQKYVPGRCGLWSDVWLDFAGFSLLAGITTLTIVIIWLTKFIIRLVKKKKSEQQVNEITDE